MTENATLRSPGGLRSPARFLPWLAPLSLLGTALQFLSVLHARRIVPDLTQQIPVASPGHPASLPEVSVIVPARDEALALRHALPTLLSQDYPSLEVIVVDDRSEDDTRAVAEAAMEGCSSAGVPRAAFPQNGGVRAVVHRVEHLPGGWLGKSHALYQGARLATGQWLLFTDADVCFEPSALRRAIEYAEKESLDHLTLVPKLDLGGYWLRGVAAFFYLGYMINLGMYRTNVPGSRIGLGIGAFNLLRREAYRAIGTYEALRLSAADDQALGRAVKRAGLRQRLLTAVGAGHRPPPIRLRWYDSLAGFFRGIEKNVLPICAYNPLAVIGVVLTAQVTSVLPFVAPLFGSVRANRGALWAYASAAALALASSLQFGRHQRHPRPLALALGHPISGLISCYALLRAMVVVLRAGGMTWRGTFYSLEDLRIAELRERKGTPIART